MSESYKKTQTTQERSQIDQENKRAEATYFAKKYEEVSIKAKLLESENEDVSVCEVEHEI